MYVQGVDRVFDLNFNGRDGRAQAHLRRRVPAGRAGVFALQLRARRHRACCSQHFRDAEKECKALLEAGAPERRSDNDKRHKLALPAYDQCIKASHIFNLLDARGVISVTERQSYILRVRELAKACCGGVAGDGRGRGVMQSFVHPGSPAMPSLVHAGRGSGAEGQALAPTQAFEATPRPRPSAPTSAGSEASRDGERRRGVRAMAELLLELFSEEIPARMQARAAEDLRRLVTEGLKAQGLEAGEAKAFATPRRLTLVVEGVPAKSPAVSEERKGPRVDAPEQAIAGFLKAAGLEVDQGGRDRQGREEGRLLRRQDREAGPRGGGDRRRGGAGGGRRSSRGRSRCAGARARTSGCGRCIRSCACSTARSCRSRSRASRAATTTRGHRFHGNEPFEVSRARPTTPRASRAHKVILDAEPSARR